MRSIGAGPVIAAAGLAAALTTDAAPVVLDVRWVLGGPPGAQAYAAGHIPGAVFVDLETELAAPAGAGGRHPLPAASDFGAAMAAKGVSAARRVVVYDASTSVAAARAWWLLRYYGHPDVAVLDGGLAAWVAAGRPLQRKRPQPTPGDFAAMPGGLPTLDAAGAAAVASGPGRLLDARAPERFAGEQEPVDPVAGHIPGARNHPASANLGPDGRFLERDQLRAALQAAGVAENQALGAYCGSGITAAHTVLAAELAGFGAALYPGSWSEWITDPARPVATGL
jgi:thiosulfate/3-mercaptopyruvate sulfurtransferase